MKTKILFSTSLFACSLAFSSSAFASSPASGDEVDVIYETNGGVQVGSGNKVTLKHKIQFLLPALWNIAVDEGVITAASHVSSNNFSSAKIDVATLNGLSGFVQLPSYEITDVLEYDNFTITILRSLRSTSTYTQKIYQVHEAANEATFEISAAYVNKQDAEDFEDSLSSMTLVGH